MRVDRFDRALARLIMRMGLAGQHQLKRPLLRNVHEPFDVGEDQLRTLISLHRRAKPKMGRLGSRVMLHSVLTFSINACLAWRRASNSDASATQQSARTSSSGSCAQPGRY